MYNSIFPQSRKRNGSAVIPFSITFFQRAFRQASGFNGDIDFFPSSCTACYSIIRFVIVREFYARRYGALIIFDRTFATKCHMPVKSLKIPFALRRRLLALPFADKCTSVAYKSPERTKDMVHERLTVW